LKPSARPLTDEDGEVRELTREDFRRMRPIAEVDPGMLEAVAQWRKVGRPKAITPKTHISFRLAAEVVEGIKATGRGYNARVEQALREAFVAVKAVGRTSTKAGRATKVVGPVSKAGRVTKAAAARAAKRRAAARQAAERAGAKRKA
jgi:uncharacterized protein (DUF4415 family)